MSQPQYRPMLAAKWTDVGEAKLVKILLKDEFIYGQPKIDGMRVLCDSGIARSRSWKEWTNVHLQQFVRDNAAVTDGWDGEIIPGHMYSPEVFRDAMSGVRASEGAHKFTYYVFDLFKSEYGYQIRKGQLERKLKELGGAVHFESGFHMTSSTGVGYDVKVVFCPTVFLRSVEEVLAYEETCLEQGWEGTILRRYNHRYKYNRAGKGLDSCELIKMKRFEDMEVEITGWEPRFKNLNEATTNALGYTERSAHQENLEAQECLGALQCRTVSGVEFKVGVFKGLTLGEKEALWDRRDELIGRVIKIKHQGYGGGYDAPRTPVFHGFRDPLEL